MAAAVLRNICIYRNDPCNTRWWLEIENVGLGSPETQCWEGQNSFIHSFIQSLFILGILT